jgi:hypothetical protein
MNGESASACRSGLVAITINLLPKCQRRTHERLPIGKDVSLGENGTSPIQFLDDSVACV